MHGKIRCHAECVRVCVFVCEGEVMELPWNLIVPIQEYCTFIWAEQNNELTVHDDLLQNSFEPHRFFTYLNSCVCGLACLDWKRPYLELLLPPTLNTSPCEATGMSFLSPDKSEFNTANNNKTIRQCKPLCYKKLDPVDVCINLNNWFLSFKCVLLQD